MAGQFRIPAKRAIDQRRIRVDEQLRRVEPMAAFRLPGTLDTQAVAQPRAGTFQQSMMDVAGATWQRQQCELGLAGFVEDGDKDARAILREDGEADAAFHKGWAHSRRRRVGPDPQGLGQGVSLVPMPRPAGSRCAAHIREWRGRR